jgi:hypothetical protein
MGPLSVRQSVDAFKQCARTSLPRDMPVAKVRAALGLNLADLSLLFGQQLSDANTIKVSDRVYPAQLDWPPRPAS